MKHFFSVCMRAVAQTSWNARASRPSDWCAPTPPRARPVTSSTRSLPRWAVRATHHADAEDSLILFDGAPIGRELIDRSGAQCCLVDIALLPAYQNRGIGSARLRQLIEHSERAAQTVVLHVDRSSRAQHLYTRHGFTVVADDGVYLQMVRSATAD